MKTWILSSLLLSAGLSGGVARVPALAPQSPAPSPSPQREHPDGSVKCPVTGKLLLKGKGVPAHALGHTYRVADEAAAKELADHPDQYLLPDGTPKNQ